MSEHQSEGAGRLFLHGKPVDDYIESHEHVSPTSSYVKILLALFFLTGLTYAVSFANLGPASLPVAMFVAFIKASLVCMYFMHLKYDDRYHVFVFLSTLLFVAIFFVFTMFDLNSRARLNEQSGTFFLNDYDKDGVVEAAKKKADEAMANVIAHDGGGGEHGEAEGEHAEGEHAEGEEAAPAAQPE